jgi:hypothetical protein
MRRQMTHPGSDVLAEHRAGLISGRRGARIAAHLSGCDHCAAVGAQLAEISVLLAAAPVPAMPDSVAHRLDTVLAAEAAKRNDAERAGAQAPGERAAHPRRARRGGWRLVTVRVLAPAAAVVALATVGFELSHIGGPTNSGAASSAAGPAVGSSAAASAAPSAAKLTVPANGRESRAALVPAFRSLPAFKVFNSPTSYQRSTLRQQIEREVRAPAGPAESASAQIKGCVSRVTAGSGGEIPVLVEKARFEGQPAIVIVASRNGSYTAWVTGPGCSAAGDTVLVTQSGISAP